ncbi:MAG: 30S ribosomal protein S15 [Pseudomonadota bacterium]|nr:30S ribosomal protein S15 [Pseudomonadota bacterium]
MSITTERTAELVKQFGGSEQNSGKTEVQVAILTDRIRNLTEHFKTNKQDNHSRRGLIRLVNQRRSLLAYLRKKDETRYVEVIKALGLRK